VIHLFRVESLASRFVGIQQRRSNPGMNPVRSGAAAWPPLPSLAGFTGALKFLSFAPTWRADLRSANVQI
jgi:hypothetical protein